MAILYLALGLRPRSQASIENLHFIFVMNTLSSKTYPYKAVSIFLFIWCILWALNLGWSRDVHNTYEVPYRAAQALTFFERFNLLEFYRDPAYFALQNIFASFLPFQYFLGLVILISLSLKFLALWHLSARPGLLEVFPYFAVLSFLHEGTQIRIALALSIVMLAMVFWIQAKRFISLILLFLGCLFHWSAAIYTIVFATIFLAQSLGTSVYFVAGGMGVAVMGLPLLNDFIVLVAGPFAHARYTVYLDNYFVGNQNSSGLFPLFILFIIALVGLVWILFKPNNLKLQYLKLFALVSGCLSIGSQIIFRFSVIIASRFGDLLLLPVLIAMGFTLAQINHEKRYFLLSSIICALISYAGVRAYITFGPLLTKSFL